MMNTSTQPPLPSPRDIETLFSLVKLLSDPKAAQQLISDLSRAADDARETIAQAGKDRAAAERATETAKIAMEGARRLSERESEVASREAESKKRWDALEFRERHIEDLNRKADADAKSAAATRSDLERRLAAIKRAAGE